ncbi:MAG: dTMP kinase, partial [Actinobacteria bacterium]|nr:dTMP kinase [Actinomycetota bacterium]
MRGRFITIEGIDGAGKTTLATALRDELSRERPVHLLREPGGVTLSERLRELVKDPALRCDARAEALLYAAARAQLVDELLRPLLDDGAWVLLDRFVDSSLAYQGGGRGLGIEPSSARCADGPKLRATLSGRTPEFELERFERVAAGTKTVLLRIAGRWRMESRERLSPPMLLVDDGRRTRRLSPLPGPDDDAPRAGPDPPDWRAAYSVAAEHVAAGQIAFALETSHGIVDLPRPVAASSKPLRQAEPPPRPAPPAAPQINPRILREERRRREDAERASESRRQAMAALEQRLDAEREARSAAEQATRDVRDELARVRAEAEAAVRGGERRVREVDERIAFLEAARAEINAARAELDERIAAERTARQQLETAVTARDRELLSARGEAETAARASERAVEQAREQGRLEAERAQAEARAARAEAEQAAALAAAQSETAREEMKAAAERAEAAVQAARDEARQAIERAQAEA